MNFEEALLEMRKGKCVKLKDSSYFLKMITKIYIDNDYDRELDVLRSDYILSNDWEIVE